MKTAVPSRLRRCGNQANRKFRRRSRARIGAGREGVPRELRVSASAGRLSIEDARREARGKSGSASPLRLAGFPRTLA